MTYDSQKMYEIPLKDIWVDSDFNCRGPIDPLDVMDLAKSIKERGLMQPVVLQSGTFHDKPFRLVAGFRRYKAHQIAKKDTILSVVRTDLTDLDARILNLTENLQRANLNMKQEAHAIAIFRDANWIEEEIVRKVGMSRGWVQVRLKLLDLPDEIQNEAAAGLLTQQQIRNCHALPTPEQQFEYIRAVKDAKLLGKKRPVQPHNIGVKNLKKARTPEEIFEMQDLIRDTFKGNNLATRALAWASGEISDLDIHRSLEQEAKKAGKFYLIPEGLHGKHSQPE